MRLSCVGWTILMVVDNDKPLFSLGSWGWCKKVPQRDLDNSILPENSINPHWISLRQKTFNSIDNYKKGALGIERNLAYHPNVLLSLPHTHTSCIKVQIIWLFSNWNPSQHRRFVQMWDVLQLLFSKNFSADDAVMVKTPKSIFITHLLLHLNQYLSPILYYIYFLYCRSKLKEEEMIQSMLLRYYSFKKH